MKGLSKSRIQAHRQCPRRLWLQTFKPEAAKEDPAADQRMAAGTQAGEIARDLYPGGHLIDAGSLDECLTETRQFLASQPDSPLFEATCEYQGVLVRADLLIPDGQQHRLVEVKSSTSVKDYHYDDATIQAWVCRGAGIDLSRVAIAHIDNQFVYPGEHDYRGLFREADITAEVMAQEEAVSGWASAARETLAGEEPDIAPGDQCHSPFTCPFFEHCQPLDPADEERYPPGILPYGGRLADELETEGYTDLREVPEARLENPRHLRVWRATRNNATEIDPAAGDFLAALPWPRYYIDFETMQFAVPIWKGTRPYQQIPFQWSCHIEYPQVPMEHLAFLADNMGDPRHDFARTLLRAIGDTGPIFVYNAGFESRILRELAEAFPDLAEPLLAACERIVDLLPLARKHYYHPAMRGSWSIKAVLPTIAPDLDYQTLAVGDGGMAQEAFGEILDPETDPERRHSLRDALLEYCKLDTLAMVRLAHFFQEHGADATG